MRVVEGGGSLCAACCCREQLCAHCPTPPTAPLLPPVLGLLALPIALLALTPLLLEALLLYTPLLELGRLDRPVVDDVERVLLFVFMFVAI